MRASGAPEDEWRSGGRALTGVRGGHRAVLVVEDDVDFRELLVDHLAASAWPVRAAGNGAQALDVLAQAGGQIGLILLDLRMPVMDGFELCRRLEADPGARVPIVIMTAEHETQRVERSPRVVTVLYKPLDIARLDSLVAAHLRPR